MIELVKSMPWGFLVFLSLWQFRNLHASYLILSLFPIYNHPNRV